MHLEIERKFLLKSLPNIEPDDILCIDQFYMKNEEGVFERARISVSQKTDETKYIHTVKALISNGVCSEDEHELTKDEFEDFKSKWITKEDSTYISKRRFIYKFGKLKWEVDMFESGYTLIVAEIEIPTRKYRLRIPDFIKEVLLIEVTGKQQFSNRSLSLKIN